MKRKLSNKAKVGISNAQHNRLRSKNNTIFCFDPSERKAEKAIVKCWYHAAVVDKQTLLGRLLSKDEKRQIFAEKVSTLQENKKRNKK